MAQAAASDSLDAAVELANSLLQPAVHENDGAKLMQESRSMCTDWPPFHQESSELDEKPLDSLVNQALFDLECSPANLTPASSAITQLNSSSLDMFDNSWPHRRPMDWAQDKFYQGHAPQLPLSQQFSHWPPMTDIYAQSSAMPGYTTSVMPLANLSTQSTDCMFAGTVRMPCEGKALPPTPPVDGSMQPSTGLWYETPALIQQAPSPPLSIHSQVVNTPMQSCYFPNVAMTQQGTLTGHPSQSSCWNTRPQRKTSPTGKTGRRRTSAHPSVASVVSLTAHEPVAHVIQGVPHITFLYSHDRLVKEYTVRTDVENCSLDEIPLDFRMHNAIYPRANVKREDYDGNRWDYETSCNKLGWQLCWLNKDQLCGRRGLIQRAVDSYRNRHAEMRSRRVSRQEKVANGTLRRRRSKRA